MRDRPGRSRGRGWDLGYRGFLFVLLLCWFWQDSAAAANRRALLIGIGDYSGSALAPPPDELRTDQATHRFWQPLYGPINDVRAIQQILLEQHGFSETKIRTLLDRQATRNHILEALQDHLVDAAEAGDQVFFYFAGHGSQVQNSLSDEPDKLDETLVPADAALGWPDIRDKDLRPFFNKILDKGAHLTVILDSCHSGSAARGLPGDSIARGVLPDHRDHPLLPFGPRPDERGAVILAAAQDYEKAYERLRFDGKTYGVFSWALVKAMGELGPGVSVRDLFSSTRGRMHGDKGSFQEPLLLARKVEESAPLFGQSAAPRKNRERFAIERILQDGRVILSGGWANRLTVGSELKSATEAQVKARLRVEEVLGPMTSRASILSEETPRPAIIRPGTLFDLEVYGVPESGPLDVWLPSAHQAPESLARFAAELEASATAHGVTWIDDPTEVSPTHSLRCNDGFWELLSQDGTTPRVLGIEPRAEDVLNRLRDQERPRLFLQMPVPDELERWLELGLGKRYSAVQPVQDPALADFVLVGRSRAGKNSYAWVRPGATALNHLDAMESVAALPSRTDWLEWPGPSTTVGLLAEVGGALEESVLGLANLRAWLDLVSPSSFGYNLAFREEGQRQSAKETPKLLEGTHYTITLRRKEPDREEEIHPRNIYVFAIDSHGRSSLLFPVATNENRFPSRRSVAADYPSEIDLGPESRFLLTPPLGAETFFLLATAEPLSNPWALEFEGVTSRRLSNASPLEKLLSRTGYSQRTATPAAVSASWSLSRKTLLSVPKHP